MHVDKNLSFIMNKIVHLNVALFHSETNSVLRIPTTIIKTYSVQDDGYIFFFLPRPKQLLCEFEKEFSVKMNYFKKGANHYINVQGFARLINDPEELHCYDLTPEQMNIALNREVFVKVKILKADYYENDPTRKGVFSKIRSFVYSMLEWVEPQAKSFDFSSRAQELHNFGF